MESVGTYNKQWCRNVLDRVSSMQISTKNKQFLGDFENYLFSTGSGEPRVAKLISQLCKMVTFEDNGVKVFSCDLDVASKRDIMRLIAYINKSHYSEATKSDYRRCVKQFYRWYKEEDERIYSNDIQVRTTAMRFYNYIEKEVRRAYVKKEIDPSTIITDDDVDKVIAVGCRSVKEKAFIRFLHETGVRAGEMLNLKVKHIEIRKNMGVAHIDGKTGRRTVQFVNSLPLVVQWLELHPNTDIPESFLWLGESYNRRFVPLIYRGAIKLVERCFRRAGVIKKHNLHWFRHSRASILAPKMTDHLLNKYMGWTPGSRQSKDYVHLCVEDLEKAYLKMNGLVEEENKEKLPQVCGCGQINESCSRYCFKCGNPLNVSVALQDAEMMKSETNKAITEMMQMMKNPGMLKEFQEFKKNRG